MWLGQIRLASNICLASLTYEACSAVLGRKRDTSTGAAVESRMANSVEGVRTAPAGDHAGESGETDRGLHLAATRVATTHLAKDRPVPAIEV